MRDVRYSFRMLVSSPGFSIAAVVILALGVAANTAIFSVVDAVLLRPLPIAHPGGVVVIHNQLPSLNLPRTEVSAPQFLDYSRDADAFESTGALTTQNFNLTGVEVPERLQAVRATANLLPMLGVAPLSGRLFTQEEDQRGSNSVTLLSNHVWRRLFNSDPGMLGKMLQLDGQGYQVIGIMPAGLDQLYPNADLWIPMAFTSRELSEERRGSLAYGMLARLKPGVSLGQAQAAMSSIARNIPGASADFNIEVRSLLEEQVGDVRKPLYVLLAAVAVVLLICCANIASLLLARASGRSREMAVRAALGARRGLLIRQLLVESLLLATTGGAFGALLARWGVEGLLRIAPANLPRLNQVHLDLRVLLFTVGVSVASGVVFGVVPAIAASRTNLTESLNESGRSSSAGPARQRLRGALVIGEVALGFTLLISGGLLVRSFARLLQVRPGFNPHNVLTMRLSLPWSAYPGNQRVVGFYNSILDRIKALPGVEHAAAAYQPPFTPGGDNSIFLIRNYQPEPDQPRPHADYLYVTPGYFETMGIPLVEGRWFAPSDLRTNGSTGPGAAAVIDEALARRFWPDRDPIGAEIGWGGDSWATIVGVVGTALRDDLSGESKGTFYFCGSIPVSTLVVRTATDPSTLAQAAIDEIHSIDPNQPVYDVKTLDERIGRSLDQRRFAVVLIIMFAGMALLLAAIGLYGVISYVSAQRTHEVGIRMALGANSIAIVAMLTRQATMLVLAGLGMGFLLALIASRYLSSLLYGISAVDTPTFIGVPVVLMIVAAAAAFVPAWRAVRTDPMIALRYQ
jgi:putative ABC transport system permease protein